MKTHKHVRLYLVACLLALLSLTAAAATKIFAQTTTIDYSTVVCAYTYSEWSDCKPEGYQYRSVVSKSPDNCNTSLESPTLKRTCTYVPPSVPCTYTYSDWSRCDSSNYQTRTVTSKSPTYCDTALQAPILKQTCTYAPTTTDTTSTTSTSVVCSYTYSDWSACDSSGFQSRKVLSQTPTNCNPALTYPVTKRACTYSPPSTSTTTTTTSTSDATACSYTYSTWSVCNEFGKQKRFIISKSPAGCLDSAVPILEQSCAYSATALNIICAYNLSDWSVCNAQGMQTRTLISRTPSGCYDSEVPRLSRPCETTASSDSAAAPTSVTPYFNFLNINGGEVLSGEVKIQGTVSSAYGVEFYIIQQESNTPKFLGKAALNTQKVWEYTFDSSQQPNGTFYVRPMIKNAYGAYEGEKRLIIILNATPEMKLAEGQTAPSEENFESSDRTNSQWQEKYFKSAVCLDEKICGGEADPDRDGVTNNEEFRYGTDPRSSDTDRDGFLDGDEIKNGFDPTKAAPGDKSDRIIFESPKEAGETKADIYKIEEVRLAQTDTGENKLVLKGKALPNSFITVYIFSDPIVLTVKTDENGDWSYELDKDIQDGQHEVYVAVTDNTGKITAKSAPLAFVKTAQAVEIIPPAEAAASLRSASPVNSWLSRNILIFISMVLAGLAISIAAIGMRVHKAHAKENSNPQL